MEYFRQDSQLKLKLRRKQRNKLLKIYAKDQIPTHCRVYDFLCLNLVKLVKMIQNLVWFSLHLHLS